MKDRRRPLKIFEKLSKWELAMFAIGIIAVILSIIVHFTSLSDTRVKTTSTVTIPLNSPEFFSTIEHITNTSAEPLQNSNLTLLNNGDEFIPDLLNEIDHAEHSVTLTNYIWKEGTLTDELLDALIAKAKAGVEVRVLMDGKGSIGNPEEKIKELEAAGGHMAIFRPLTLRTITRWNKRSHVRAIVVDGKIGYIGGAAFDDGWLGNGTGVDSWRDMMFKFTGNGAASIQTMFNDLWRQTDGEILSGVDFYPPTATSTADDPCNASCFIPLLHSPTPDLEKDLSQMIWLSIMGAHDHIWLSTPYLLPDQNILDALKEKAEEGVDIEIMVPGPFIDSRIVKAASRSYYKDVLEAGMHIYEYQPAGYHAKMLTVDGEWSVIGSANLDNRSSTLNVEGVMGVKDAKLASDLEREFTLDKSQSNEVTLETYKPSIFGKLFSGLASLFAKQY